MRAHMLPPTPSACQGLVSSHLKCSSSPPLLRGGFGFWFCSGSLSHELGSSREAARLLIFPHPRSVIFLFVATPPGSEADKPSGCQVPTMVLSETRGLWLSWVVRGGIE